MKIQTFRKPHQWLNFWLEKYSETLVGLKYNAETRKRLWATLKLFLEKLSGNPRNIPLEAVKAFVEEDPAQRLKAIILFYRHIAHSKPHIEMLEQMESVYGSIAGVEAIDPVERFRKFLEESDSNQSTIKNYCATLSSYLRWLNADPTGTSISKIAEYRRYLTEEKKLAPGTIELHCSVIKRFYNAVIEAP